MTNNLISPHFDSYGWVLTFQKLPFDAHLSQLKFSFLHILTKTLPNIPTKVFLPIISLDVSVSKASRFSLVVSFSNKRNPAYSRGGEGGVGGRGSSSSSPDPNPQRNAGNGKNRVKISKHN